MSAELFADYQRLGSVHRVGKERGMSGDAVHKRLRAAGFDISRPVEFTDAQVEAIQRYYSETPASQFDLEAFAASLGKSKANVSRKARRLGLTNKARPSSAAHKEKTAAGLKGVWSRKPHPRGMAGKKHTEERKQSMAEKHKLNWATSKAFDAGYMAPEVRSARSERMAKIAAARPAHNNYTRCKGGYREDLGDIYFRSSWEANYARYLNLLWKMKVIEKWEYEPETFWFLNIRRGVRSYRPDFLVQYKGEAQPVYVEVKGWMDAKSKTKIARFKKYYPQHRLETVGLKEYNGIKAKWGSAIPMWEGK
jgi:hypothetical protein